MPPIDHSATDPNSTVAGTYRHTQDKRKSLPEAGRAAQGRIREVPKQVFAYDPHLPPVLRSDPTGQADRLSELLAEAQRRPLNSDEVEMLAEALRNRQPWLEWAGKREAPSFAVDPVALHIHERVAAQAVVQVAARKDVTRDLFADPELEYRQAVQFYQHDVNWANRLILGDSLQVMASLAKREDLAGKVQMIYMDPPYGIKYGSNFQSEVGRRDVKDRPEDLTREPEVVKAYRDTWHLGVHSYLAYLRDRLMLAKDLLTDSGSIFVQISDENLHRVRMVMDEVFGPENFVSQISVQKTGSAVGSFIQANVDLLLWYAKDRVQAEQKFRPIMLQRLPSGVGGSGYTRVEEENGAKRPALDSDLDDAGRIKSNIKLWRSYPLTSDGFRETTTTDFSFQNGTYHPGRNRHWGVRTEHLDRVGKAERLIVDGQQISMVRYWQDHPIVPLDSYWGDLGGVNDRVYVVQTNVEVVKRCILMTTDPGDLVLDPTCGSGTTAYVAEQWGRRWITIDSSRVAVAIARQRLLTAQYDYYTLRDAEKGVDGGFVYKTVPHITLKSIAQNVALDPIFAQWEPVLAEKLEYLNLALEEVTPETRQALLTKLELKTRRRDKADPVTDADRRRWKLPAAGIGWQEWEVPFDTDPDWPVALQEALNDYRAAWRCKRDAVNAAIAARAEMEELVDRPEIDRAKLRVSGPFTVEGVMPAEESLDLDDSPIGGAPEELPTFSAADSEEVADTSANAEAYLDKMLRLLRNDGVRFPDNKVIPVGNLESLSGGVLHAEGEWGVGGETRRVAVVFGPEHGPVTAKLVEDCLPRASRGGYEDIVFAGFSFDGAAQALIQDDPNPHVHCHLAHIRPDVAMTDLLKETPNANNQIFTVSGLPRASVIPAADGQWIAVMEGVDIYDPVANAIHATGADKVAAWFLDSDYDGAAFCITQAFFPDSKAWEKLAKALGKTVDPENFAAFSGTHSLPFPTGQHRRAAVKVIDPRGNEVVRILPLEGTRYRA